MNAQPKAVGAEEFVGDEERNRRVVKTLDMAQRFLSDIFDDPRLLDAIPEGASVIFIPEDDAETAQRNLAAAERMRRAGKIVHVVRMPSAE